MEYANQIWKPHLKKHIHAIENVQRRATRLLPGMQNLTYEERLKKLKLPTLEYRRTRGDMIEAFKITSGHYKHQAIENFLPLNNRTSRGHSKKLHHQQASIYKCHSPRLQNLEDVITSQIDKGEQCCLFVTTKPSCPNVFIGHPAGFTMMDSR